jgi:hypothetical protein
MIRKTLNVILTGLGQHEDAATHEVPADVFWHIEPRAVVGEERRCAAPSTVLNIVSMRCRLVRIEHVVTNVLMAQKESKHMMFGTYEFGNNVMM